MTKFPKDKFNKEWLIEQNVILGKTVPEIAKEYHVNSSSIYRLFKRRGVVSIHHTEKINLKRKKTMLERFGVEEPLQNKEILERYRKTCFERYGHKHPQQSEEVRERTKQSCLEKYGKEYPLLVDEFKEKSKKTCLEKYGVDNISKKDMPKESLDFLNDKEWLTDQHYNQKKSQSKLAEELGVSQSFVSKKFIEFEIETKYFGFSDGEKQLLDFIKSIYSGTIEENIQTIIPPYELDIYLPELKVAIEYNGEYWHQNTQERDQLKYEMCQILGIDLYTIWDYQWLGNSQQVQEDIKKIILDTN